MTIFYPDVSSAQAGISFTGAPIAMVKATQSTGYTNPDFAPATTRAKSAGAFFAAYHFLVAGNAAAQAQHAFNVVGKVTPLMLDFEPTTGSNPSVNDALGFIDAYRKLGGICYLLYLPKWYWQQIGSPSLSGFISRGMAVVSSAYTTYSDTGIGWAPYGGMTPAVWQYSDNHSFNGFSVDFNAFKGTLSQFISLATTGSLTPVSPSNNNGDRMTPSVTHWKDSSGNVNRYHAVCGSDGVIYWMGPETNYTWQGIPGSNCVSGVSMDIDDAGNKYICYVNPQGNICQYFSAVGGQPWVWQNLGGNVS